MGPFFSRMFFWAGFDTRTRTRISLSLCLHKDTKRLSFILVLFFLQGYFHALLVHGSILCDVCLAPRLEMRGLLVGCFEVHCVACCVFLLVSSVCSNLLSRDSKTRSLSSVGGC